MKRKQIAAADTDQRLATMRNRTSLDKINADPNQASSADVSAKKRRRSASPASLTVFRIQRALYGVVPVIVLGIVALGRAPRGTRMGTDAR